MFVNKAFLIITIIILLLSGCVADTNSVLLTKRVSPTDNEIAAQIIGNELKSTEQPTIASGYWHRLEAIQELLSKEAADSGDFTADTVIDVLIAALASDDRKVIISRNLLYSIDDSICMIDYTSEKILSGGTLRMIKFILPYGLPKCMFEYISFDENSSPLYSDCFMIHQEDEWQVFEANDAAYIFIGGSVLSLTDTEFTFKNWSLPVFYSEIEKVSLLQTDEGDIFIKVNNDGTTEELPFDPQSLSFGYPLSIPDPQLVQQNNCIDLKDPNDYGLTDAMLMADLSWLDFKHPVKLSGFGVGGLPGREDAIICSFQKFLYNDGESLLNQELVSGSYLVLVVAVTEKTPQDNYIVILDYANKKSYKIPTIIPFAWGHTTNVILEDLTGDGAPEIMVWNSPNGYRTGDVFEVVKVTENGLKSIYQRDLSFNSAADNYIDVTLLDEYIVRVTCAPMGFCQDIPLSDAGLFKEDLEIDVTTQNSIEISVDDEANRCYINGKVVRQDIRVGFPVILGVSGPDSVMELNYPIYLGRWQNVADIRISLKYDPYSDTLVLKQINVYPA